MSSHKAQLNESEAIVRGALNSGSKCVRGAVNSGKSDQIEIFRSLYFSLKS